MSVAVSPIVVYVAGPYRDARGPYYIRENIRAAEAVAVRLWQAGFPALTPHLNTALMDGIAPDGVFLAGDLLMMRRCDAVVLVADWRRSQGTKDEFNEAWDRGIPVFEADDPALLDGLREVAARAQQEASTQ